MMLKHTKIVATISDKMCEVDFLQKLFDEDGVLVEDTAKFLEKFMNSYRDWVKQLS